MALESVIGQRIRMLVAGRREIIGVVGDVTLDVYGRPTAAVYSAHRQFASSRNWELTQVVAINGPREQILPAVRSAVAAMDAELVVHRAAAMNEIVGRGVGRERFALVLMGSFAGVSLTLAAIGLYGVLGYAVGQRSREIGIRYGTGGDEWRRARADISPGRARSWGRPLGRHRCRARARTVALSAALRGPWDARILTTTVLLLTVTALIAAWLPARRASRIQPGIAMHEG